jgi:hypothetical protein
LSRIWLCRIDCGKLKPLLSGATKLNMPPYHFGCRRSMRITLLVLLCFTFTGCGLSQPRQTRSEITGTQAARVADATSTLSKHCQLPGPLLDAHMAEDVHDNSGGMVPGPSDFWFFGVLSVPAADLPKWRKALSPVIAPVSSGIFTSPIAPPSWWPSAAAFEGCEFYGPQKLTGRIHGFVAVSSAASAIYFSTRTD